jgi:metal-responsive CopG/Arc/MetJ family transcriptional regulator
MRTILEIPNEKVKELDRLCKAQKISRAELVRRAIDKYLLDTPTSQTRSRL